jgi:hypothetical protein
MKGDHEKVIQDLTGQLSETMEQKAELETRLRNLCDLEDCKKILSSDFEKEDSARFGGGSGSSGGLEKSNQETIVSLSKQLSQTIKQNLDLEAKLEAYSIECEESRKRTLEMKQMLG